MGGQKHFLIYFQKLHEMARKLNEIFFGPPLHPKNSHFLSIIFFTLKFFTQGKNCPTDVLVKHRVLLSMVSNEDMDRNQPWVFSYMLDLHQAGGELPTSLELPIIVRVNSGLNIIFRIILASWGLELETWLS